MDHEPAIKEHTPLLSSSSSLSLKRSASDGSTESKRGSRSQQTVSDPHWALDRQHSDAVINFLIRIACQVHVSETHTVLYAEYLLEHNLKCLCPWQTTFKVDFDSRCYTCKYSVCLLSVSSFLLPLICQVSDSQSQPTPGGPASSGEILSKRCVSLIKTTLKPDIWPHTDIKLPWFIKLFEGLVS